MEIRRLSGRWVSFNAVGALGLVVQLGVLALLVRGLDVHYLPATVLAVEAAVLHNFLWHQRWTWRDRHSAGARETLARLGRFHVLNGTISIAGNVAVMTALTGMLGVDAIAANLAAILACSFMNFAASDMLVFRSVAALLVLLVFPPGMTAHAAAEAPAAELRPATVKAWQAYEQKMDERYDRLPAEGAGFFVHDEFRQSPGWRAAARGGAAAMFQAGVPAFGATAPDVPDGKIHHWVGAIFIPGATLGEVLDHLRGQAGREAESYEDVLASKLLNRAGDRLHIFMKLQRATTFITATYHTEHAVEYRRLGPTRATSRSVATRIAELQDAGTPREREKPLGDDHGFLWRLNAYWRYEQLSDGVLIECESVSLSRSVPLLARPFITGVVEGIARGSLQKTLRSLRAVLLRT